MLKEFKKAFTLAEVLIVIGIIGVVAALTLPNLNHATGDKETVTKVKKIHSALTEAVDRAQAIYGDADTWFEGLSTNAERSERFAKRVTEFMKVSKDCGFDAGCFSDAPLLFTDGEIFNENYLNGLQTYGEYMVELSDGISVAFAASSDIIRIRVDIDGPNKGKNKLGKDLFDFKLYTEDQVDCDDAIKDLIYPSICNSYLSGNLNDWSVLGNYTTAWVIQNGNLDYLKCADELNWETKTSCE